LIAASATDLWGFALYGAQTPARLFAVLKHMHVCNTNAAARTLTLYWGTTSTGTVAGTEIVNTITIAGYSSWDWYGLVTTDDSVARFIVGVASDTGLNFSADIEYGAAE
jgi:hypothetical protein